LTLVRTSRGNLLHQQTTGGEAIPSAPNYKKAFAVSGRKREMCSRSAEKGWQKKESSLKGGGGLTTKKKGKRRDFMDSLFPSVWAQKGGNTLRPGLQILGSGVLISRGGEILRDEHSLPSLGGRYRERKREGASSSR